MNEAVGGYFELELPSGFPGLYPEALRFQSARASFYALLCTGRPRKVWMPSYICDSMLGPLSKAGIEVSFYSINEDFSIKDEINLHPDEWILYVNYFGVCASQQREVLRKFNAEQVVFDHSQAFFAPPLDCLATIYSPRKFFGVPDGGLLITKLPVREPDEIDDGSIQRSLHLLKRLGGPPESGYADYQAAERTLEDCQYRKMSVLTERLLSSIDYESARLKRNENFRFLHKEFGVHNRLKLDVEAIDAPLCYPFFKNLMNLRESLIRERVFTPTYWARCLPRLNADSLEYELVNNLFPIPCDQRYSKENYGSAINIIGRSIDDE
ncbi:hypothetical protein E8F11_05505 [Pseudomonas sp. BN417]|uniref:hypothetical protein n=1 Tax=Pseudomonas sp. BN417 TaxID=2567890 RepID=UPI00245487DF|nr:hypothetical protein [Pseudomonas sp. BN417]MDH4554639.1 hypothetical protein [Pseudomonas sp. BN417]